MRRLTGVLCAAVLAGCGGAVGTGEQVSTNTQDANVHEVLHGNNIHAVRNEQSRQRTTGNLIDHGGPVVPTLHFYAIYWGTGFGATTKSLYTTFLSGLGQDKNWTVNTQYMRGAANSASYVASADDTSTPPATVTDANLQAEVHKVIASGALGAFDPKGLYYVITPSTVKVCSGNSCSCTNFCGYHSHYTDATYGTVLYSTIPSAAACPASCGVFTSDANSPNGNVEADEGVSVIAHEGEETQSDALGSAWFDGAGNENADKCAYKYGPTFAASNGAKVNTTIGGYNFLVQMNWSNQISGCALNGPTDGPYTQ